MARGKFSLRKDLIDKFSKLAESESLGLSQLFQKATESTDKDLDIFKTVNIPINRKPEHIKKISDIAQQSKLDKVVVMERIIENYINQNS